MLLTDKGKPDTTARQVLGVLAEHADELGGNAYPSNLRIQWATGLDERTIQRALLRLERGKLIARDGTRLGCVKWRLALTAVRPESDWTDLEAEDDKNRQAESARRAARRRRSATQMSGTQSAGPIEGDVSIPGDVRDAESRRPGFCVPASGTQNPGVRDGTPPEPPLNLQEPSRTSTGGTLPPDPLRPQAPPPSALGTDEQNSPSEPVTEHQALQRNSRPRTHADQTAPELRLVADNDQPAAGPPRGIFPIPVPSIVSPAEQAIAAATARREAARRAHQGRTTG